VTGDAAPTIASSVAPGISHRFHVVKSIGKWLIREVNDFMR
jgi:hypothetical protein